MNIIEYINSKQNKEAIFVFLRNNLFLVEKYTIKNLIKKATEEDKCKLQYLFNLVQNKNNDKCVICNSCIISTFNIIKVYYLYETKNLKHEN